MTCLLPTPSSMGRPNHHTTLLGQLTEHQPNIEENQYTELDQSTITLCQQLSYLTIFIVSIIEEMEIAYHIRINRISCVALFHRGGVAAQPASRKSFMLKVVALLLSFKHFFLYAHFDARFLPCFGAFPSRQLSLALVRKMSCDSQYFLFVVIWSSNKKCQQSVQCSFQYFDLATQRLSFSLWRFLLFLFYQNSLYYIIVRTALEQSKQKEKETADARMEYAPGIGIGLKSRKGRSNGLSASPSAGVFVAGLRRLSDLPESRNPKVSLA